MRNYVTCGLAVLGMLVAVCAVKAAEPNGVGWSWGNRAYGRLGDGESSGCRSLPGMVMLDGDDCLADLLGIAAGPSVSSVHALAWDKDGDGWAWGHGVYLQLGNGDDENSSWAVQIEDEDLTNVTELAGGTLHSLGRQSTGEVYSWGTNTAYTCVLGYDAWDLPPTDYHGTYYPYDTDAVTKPASSAPVGSISGSATHSLAVGSGYGLLAWGCNSYRQLGFTDTTEHKTTPTTVPNSSSISFVAVAAGDYHSVALAADGDVYTWGSNTFGQLGDATEGSRGSLGDPVFEDAIAIAAGYEYTVVVKDDNTVWACGANGLGQLGNGSLTDHEHVFGKVKTGESTYLTGIVTVACGSHHCLALDEDGHVWAWGSNGAGELGQGYTNPVYSSLAVQVLLDDSEPPEFLANVIAIAGAAQSSYAVVGISLSTSWPEDSDEDPLDWTYQNTQTTTQDRHKTVLTISVDDQNGNTSYTTDVTKDSGDGEVTIESTASALVWNIIGGRRDETDPGTVTLKVTVQGNVGGYAETTATLTVRPLGDIDGSGEVNIDDKIQMNNKLNSLPVTAPDEAFDLDGDGDIDIDDKIILNNILNSLPVP